MQPKAMVYDLSDSLTAAGRRRLDAETDPWARMSAAIARVLEAT